MKKIGEKIIEISDKGRKKFITWEKKKEGRRELRESYENDDVKRERWKKLNYPEKWCWVEFSFPFIRVGKRDWSKNEVKIEYIQIALDDNLNNTIISNL